MKKRFIIFCSSLFYMGSQASDTAPLPADEPIYQQCTTAFNRISPARKYSILAQLADQLPHNEDKIKLATDMVKKAVTKAESQDEDVETLSYVSLSPTSRQQLEKTRIVVTTSLNAQTNQVAEETYKKESASPDVCLIS